MNTFIVSDKSFLHSKLLLLFFVNETLLKKNFTNLARNLCNPCIRKLKQNFGECINSKKNPQSIKGCGFLFKHIDQYSLFLLLIFPDA